MINLYARRFLVTLTSTLGASCMVMNVAYGVDGVVLINQAKALAGNVTLGDLPGFPVTLSRRGSYRLSGSLHVTQAGTNGIDVAAEDVTIDLNGFTIRGPGVVGAGDGISAAIGNAAFPRLTVTNGIVRNFGRYGVFAGVQARISDLHLADNRSGGIVSEAGGLQGSVVSNNTVISNGGPGIRLVGTGDLVSGNTLWRNAGIGISAGSVCIVNGNAVSDGDSHAIFAANGCLVTGNSARSNSGLGLSLDGDAGYKDNVLTENNGGKANPQVSGGIQMGTNVCGNDTVCP